MNQSSFDLEAYVVTELQASRVGIVDGPELFVAMPVLGRVPVPILQKVFTYLIQSGQVVVLPLPPPLLQQRPNIPAPGRVVFFSATTFCAAANDADPAPATAPPATAPPAGAGARPRLSSVAKMTSRRTTSCDLSDPPDSPAAA